MSAVPAEWLDIAAEAGRNARAKRAGELAVVPVVARPLRYPAKKFFVVVEAAEIVGEELARLRRLDAGVLHGSFAEAEGYVTLPGRRGELAAESIFCGFHSLEEAQLYWAEARPGEPLTRLPRRRFQ